MTAAFWRAFESRSDLQSFGDNALLLYALELRFQLEDIESVAVDALTDSPNDKGCDLVFIDPEDSHAIIGQGWQGKSPSEKSPPARKAANLNQAISWLLDSDLRTVPNKLRAAARALRDALSDGSVTELEVWFVHNGKEAKNIQDELDQAAKTARLYADRLSSEEVTCQGVEVGLRHLEDWYRKLTVPILVGETLTVPIAGGFEVRGVDWKAFSTAVPADWLRTLHQNYKSDLFSANIRGYLGSRNVDANINNGIKATASQEPTNFWAYNNGITALVHDYEVGKGLLSLTGISIVNGAQTTGALGSLDAQPPDTAMVPARFLVCTDRSVVMKVIRFNNSQNKVEAPDFRSHDHIQKRLIEEFESIPDALYLGGRRGGHEDVIKRPPNLLPSDTVAQSLMSFHGQPGTAYNEKSKIWVSDSLYARVFHEGTTARHVIVAYSLLKALEDRKRGLKGRSRKGALTRDDQNQLTFFTNRGATLLACAAIGGCMETILDRPLTSPFSLRFKTRISPATAQKAWEPVLQCTAPLFATALKPAIESGLKNQAVVTESIESFSQLVAAVGAANRTIFDRFADRLTA